MFVDVDVAVERGERLIIMGLNGAGKTTLLRILAGIEEADLGTVALGHNASLGYYAQEHDDWFQRTRCSNTSGRCHSCPT